MGWFEEAGWFSRKKKKKKEGLDDGFPIWIPEVYKWDDSPSSSLDEAYNQKIAAKEREFKKLLQEQMRQGAMASTQGGGGSAFQWSGSFSQNNYPPEEAQSPAKEEPKIDTTGAFDYEEPEVSEFDEDCVPGCKIGAHVCGK